MTEDEERHLRWVEEQEAILLKRKDARALLDGDPAARAELERRWAPVTKTDPTV